MLNRLPLFAAAASVSAVLVLSGCSSSTAENTSSIPPIPVSSSSSAVQGPSTVPSDSAGTSSKTTIPADVVLMDVRTPAEYSTQHLEGAINVDWDNSAVFADTIATMDKGKTYFVYCRSGNRSAQAKAAMDTLGFTNVIDLGGYEQASATTGIPLV